MRELMEDEQYLMEAIAMAAENARNGGGPFGALIVKDGQIIGRGVNQVVLATDPTAHAEMMAIRDACRHTRDFRLEGSVIYTSCEPCPMCLGAIYWAHIDRIVFAATRHDAAVIGFDDSFIFEEIARKLEYRSIPTTRLKIENALEPFEYWSRHNNKTQY